jgi:hypothetical protein
MGGGLNLAVLPKREQGNDNSQGVSTRKIEENCQINTLEIIQETIGKRNTSLVGLTMKLKLDIKIYKNLHLHLDNKLIFWNKRAVITKNITTILDNEEPNLGSVQSNMPCYGLSIGFYYFY